MVSEGTGVCGGRPAKYERERGAPPRWRIRRHGWDGSHSHVLDWSRSSALCGSGNVQGDLVGGINVRDGSLGLLLRRMRGRHGGPGERGRSRYVVMLFDKDGKDRRVEHRRMACSEGQVGPAAGVARREQREEHDGKIKEVEAECCRESSSVRGSASVHRLFSLRHQPQQPSSSRVKPTGQPWRGRTVLVLELGESVTIKSLLDVDDATLPQGPFIVRQYSSRSWCSTPSTSSTATVRDLTPSPSPSPQPAHH